MTAITDLPLLAAIPVCLLLIAGAAVALIGSIGLIRLKDFYERLHAPALGSSAATMMICLASMISFAVLESRWIFHEILILVFVTLTSSVTMMLLAQSALYRDRVEGSEAVPRKPDGQDRAPEPMSDGPD